VAKPGGDTSSLFPEDMNRRLIGRIARWHFLPQPMNSQEIQHAGMSPDHVHTTGNTLVDAARWAQSQLEKICLHKFLPSNVLQFLRLHDQPQMLLVDAHKRENWGHPMQRIAAAVSGLLQLHPKLTAVWPLHSNPQVRRNVQMGLACLPPDVLTRLCLTEPLPYPAMIALLDKCSLVLTDSHALQENASALKKPVLILREEDKTQELLESGAAMIAGTMARHIVELSSELLRDPMLLSSMQLQSSPLGDGHSAHRIAKVLGCESEPRLQIERQAA
jgi:UDP-N-acetylglucosamine 2-epimerase